MRVYYCPLFFTVYPWTSSLLFSRYTKDAVSSLINQGQSQNLHSPHLYLISVINDSFIHGNTGSFRKNIIFLFKTLYPSSGSRRVTNKITTEIEYGQTDQSHTAHTIPFVQDNSVIRVTIETEKGTERLQKSYFSFFYGSVN